MLPIARSELVQIVRNRSVLLNLLMPAAAAAFFVYSRDLFDGDGGLGYVGAVLVATIGAFGLYATIVTTLAARRQTLFLKRLRSTAVGDPAILAGLVLPVALLAVVQVTVILVVLAAVSARPDDVPLLVVAVTATLLMLVALGLATAGVTSSPEQAQVTTLPLSLAVIGVASWIGISGTGDLTWVKRSLPGGSATELVIGAWNGGLSAGDSLPLLVPTLAWVVLAVVLAQRFFRWEPRR